jgi:methylated-DNA-[protein]-cysteine S-methyltransferase
LELERQLGVKPVRSTAETANVVSQLRAYFAGRRRRFDVPVDLSHVTPFVRRVLTATMQVPAGNLVSYGDIARRIGQPRASRAVGQALGRNPIPIVIPCHRVIASGGRIGGYTGGLTVKRRLMRLEGVLAEAS